MAKYIKGANVANATSYSLYKNDGGVYKLLDTSTEIEFKVSSKDSLAGSSWNLLGNVSNDVYLDLDLNFIAYGTEFTRMIWENGTGLIYIKPDGTNVTAYGITDGEGYWTDDSYAYIDIEGGDDCTNETAILFISGNGYCLNTQLDPGEHRLVVKASADGYEDSDYSNEVVYNTYDDTTTTTIVWYTNAVSETVPGSATLSCGNGFTYKEATHAKYQGKPINRIRFYPTVAGTYIFHKANSLTTGATYTKLFTVEATADDVDKLTTFEFDTITLQANEYFTVKNTRSGTDRTAAFLFGKPTDTAEDVTDLGYLADYGASSGSLARDTGWAGFDLGYEA